MNRINIMDNHSFINTVSAIILGVTLSGCVATAHHVSYEKKEIPTKKDIIKDISYDYDKFQKHGWLYTSQYYLTESLNDLSVIARYRALYQKNKKPIIQMSARLDSFDWCYINSVYDQDGGEYDFKKIDTDVKVYGYTLTSELFTFSIPLQRLIELSKENTEFKVVGQNCQAIFTVDKKLSAAFLSAINDKIPTE